MRLIVAIAAVLVLGLAAPFGAAAATYVARGGGFGHGVGMSQYGAYGLAQEGRSHAQILRHYYTGTELDRVEGERIRVLLHASRSGRTSLGNAVRAGRRRLDPRATYVARGTRSGRIVLRERGGGRVGRFRGPLAVRGEGGVVELGGVALNGVSGGRYRGAIELREGAVGGLTAVNVVSLEDYVRGVIAGEMPPSWHREALAAQAVAARSYALATSAGGEVFDQYPDTRSQVYTGVAGETARTDAATRATAGEVVTHRGEVATTFFSSSSGGHTEAVENVFGGRAIPYLRGVEDPTDSISPLHRWRYRFSRSELQSRLDGLVKGRFRRLRVVERGASPRIIVARVVGSGGSARVHGAELKQRLGTPDIPRALRRVRR